MPLVSEAIDDKARRILSVAPDTITQEIVVPCVLVCYAHAKNIQTNQDNINAVTNWNETKKQFNLPTATTENYLAFEDDYPSNTSQYYGTDDNFTTFIYYENE